MPLHDVVWPGTVAAIKGLVGVPPLGTDPALNPQGYPNLPLMGVAEGEQAGVADSPFCWLINQNFSSSPPGEYGGGASDLEATTFAITLRLMAVYPQDGGTLAEHMLMPLIEQVRQAFRLHIKMGQATIAVALVFTGDWGYIFVNGLWYRSVDLILHATEKVAKSYYA